MKSFLQEMLKLKLDENDSDKSCSLYAACMERLFDTMNKDKVNGKKIRRFSSQPYMIGYGMGVAMRFKQLDESGKPLKEKIDQVREWSVLDSETVSKNNESFGITLFMIHTLNLYQIFIKDNQSKLNEA